MCVISNRPTTELKILAKHNGHSSRQLPQSIPSAVQVAVHRSHWCPPLQYDNSMKGCMIGKHSSIHLKLALLLSGINHCKIIAVPGYFPLQDQILIYHCWSATTSLSNIVSRNLDMVTCYTHLVGHRAVRPYWVSFQSL